MENIINETLLNTLATAVCDDDDDDAEIINILGAIAADSSSSSSDSDEEMVEHPKCRGFVEAIDHFGDEDFKSHFRLNRSTVEYLIGRYEKSHPNCLRQSPGKPNVPPKTMIYMYIWYITNTLTYQQLANLFGVTQSTAWAVVRKVVAWLITIGHEYVTWPTGQALNNTKRKFLEMKNIPGVIGAIGCTHITINTPARDKHIYFNRKRNYSIVLQGIVDADMKFIDVYCGEPGSYHESRVLKRSKFYNKAENNLENMFPNSTFILGDSVYPCKKYLIPVLKDYGSLTQRQIRFNKIHSSARIVVENAFGLLKGRFRRLLKFTEQRNICAVTNLVASACVLHNICIISNDNTVVEEVIETPETQVFQSTETSEYENAESRRQQLLMQITEGD